MYCWDDEVVVVVELGMLVVCYKQGMRFVVVEAGKMMKFGRVSVKNIGNVVNGGCLIGTAKVAVGETRYLPKPLQLQLLSPFSFRSRGHRFV